MRKHCLLISNIVPITKETLPYPSIQIRKKGEKQTPTAMLTLIHHHPFLDPAKFDLSFVPTGKAPRKDAQKNNKHSHPLPLPRSKSLVAN
jgi:hypothetical protein